jgi:RimJ/RimL family protein N-acetyltransferase
MYAIRPVEDKDLEKIIGFFAEEKELRYSFPEAPYPLTLEYLKQSIESRSDSSVVVRAGAPVAFANLFNIKQGEECTIGNVIVDKKHRRKGAAQFLVHAMVDIAVDKYRVGRVIVPCWSENTAGLMLYSRLGFHTYDTVVRQFSTAGSVHVQMLEKCLDSCLDEPSPVGTI